MNVSRVTSQTQWTTLRNDLDGSTQRVSDIEEQIATGRKLNKLSDAPTDAAVVLRIDEQSSALDAYAKQGTDATGWLSTADTALQGVANVISQALGTAKASINGSLNQTARDAQADQLQSLSNQLFDLASAKQLGQPIFGGFGTDAVAKDTAGNVTYTGVPGKVQRQVAPTVTVTVNVDGQAAFGFSAGDDVFKVLKDAAAAVRSGNTAGVQDAITRLTARQTDALTALHTVGTTQNQVDAATRRRSSMQLSLTSARSALVDVDIPKATTDMQLAQDGYQAVLAAITRVAQLPSLATLLR